MPTTDNFNWDATSFFRRLCENNVLAKEKGFRFCSVSSLEGFEDAIHNILTATAILAVSDTSQGSLSIDNSPHSQRIKTVFLAMRHPEGDMEARERCLATMRELFRQLMSVLILEKVRLEEHCVIIDPRITFTEIDRYFFSGGACAYFQISVSTFTDLRFNADEWVNASII